jgi:hypothetical protein
MDTHARTELAAYSDTCISGKHNARLRNVRDDFEVTPDLASRPPRKQPLGHASTNTKRASVASAYQVHDNEMSEFDLHIQAALEDKDEFLKTQARLMFDEDYDGVDSVAFAERKLRLTTEVRTKSPIGTLFALSAFLIPTFMLARNAR